MKALSRRLARLEAVSHAAADPLVSPETLRKMAAVVLLGPVDAKLRALAEEVLAEPFEDAEAERARVREKLMGDGALVPAATQPGIESEARAILRAKLLRDDVSPVASPALP